MRSLTVIILIFLHFQCLNAQKAVTLDDCIAIALANNLTLKNSALNVERQAYEKKRTAWNSLPRLDLGASQDFEYGFNIEPSTNTRTNEDFASNDFFARARWDFLNISKFRTNRKAKIDLNKEKENYKSDRNQLIITVVQYYTQVLYQKEFSEILKQQERESSKQLKRLQGALDYGYIAKSELYDAEAEAALDQKAVILAANERERSVLNLLNLINYDDGAVMIEYVDFFSADTSAIKVLPTDVARWAITNPLALSAKYEVESARKAVQISRANSYPELSLRYQLESFFVQNLTNPDPDDEESRVFEDQIINNQTQFVGASLNIPLFNGLQNRYATKIAKVNVEAAKVNEELVKDNLKFEIQTTINEIENAISTYITSLQVLRAGLESFRTSKLKYEQGKINAFNFAIAKKNLLRAEVELIEVKYNLFFNKKKLEILSSGQSILP